MKNITEQKAKEIFFERGYNKTVTINFPKGDIKEAHQHPFSADIIIISGSIKVVVADKEYNLTLGDNFQLGAGIEHAEYTGEDGVTIVAAIPESIQKRTSL
jgi:quercetin dioxygenase-like cupin family protein